MMQYHNWDSYILGNTMFVIEGQYVLLFAIECTDVKDCSEKLN